MSERQVIDGFEAFGRIQPFIRRKYGTQRKCARALGLSKGHLSDMLNARCELSPVLLAAAELLLDQHREPWRGPA